jgi:hypothetical protein
MVLGLWEVEHWLAEVDKHCIRSIPDVSDYHTSTFFWAATSDPSNDITHNTHK